MLLDFSLEQEQKYPNHLFHDFGPYHASQRKVPLIPMDKYQPKNIKTYDEYLHYLVRFDTRIVPDSNVQT